MAKPVLNNEAISKIASDLTIAFYSRFERKPYPPLSKSTTQEQLESHEADEINKVFRAFKKFHELIHAEEHG